MRSAAVASVSGLSAVAAVISATIRMKSAAITPDSGLSAIAAVMWMTVSMRSVAAAPGFVGGDCGDVDKVDGGDGVGSGSGLTA